MILAYHDVTSPECFSTQLDYLCAVMHPVSLAEVLAAMEEGVALPRSSVLLTFDDGDRTIYDTALPIMRELQVPGVIFPVAGLVGTARPFWWSGVKVLIEGGAAIPGVASGGDADAAISALKRMTNDDRIACIEELQASTGQAPVMMQQLHEHELKEMEASGFAVGNHTLEHPCLDQCSDEVLEREIITAHEVLKSMLDDAPVVFAYPNGNRDPRAEFILQKLGYKAAFLFDHRIGRFPPQDPLRISRVRVSSTTPPDRFRIILSGLHPALHHLIGRS